MSDDRRELMGRGALAIGMRTSLKNAGDVERAARIIPDLIRAELPLEDPAQPWRRFLSRGYETAAARVLEFHSFDDFCKRWLEVSWDELMHRLKPCPNTLAYLSRIEGWDQRKASAIHEAKAAEPMAEKRRPTKAEQEDRGAKSDNIRLNSHGTGSSYLAARLARDHPDILERMKRGEFRSVRAAALEAGIVKPQKTYTGSALERATKAVRDLSDDERAALLELVAKGRA